MEISNLQSSSIKMSDPCICPIPEIDYMIIGFLDHVVDFKQLTLVNKYYHQLIKNDNIYQDFLKFSKINEKMLALTNFKNSHPKEYLFCLACKYNCPFVAKYVFDKYSIDVHIAYDYAFRLSCLCGNIELVKWLYSLMANRENIHCMNDLAFQYSCEHGYLEIAKYLYYSDSRLKKPQQCFNFPTWRKINVHPEIVRWLNSLSINEF